jgi:hypothetical protein
MSGITSTQNLQYTTGTDLLQASGEALEDLAERTDARLKQAYALLSVSQTPPLTVIESKVFRKFTRSSTDALTFDTVVVDTQDGANFADDSRVITLRRTGYWNVGCYVQCEQFDGVSTGTGQLFMNGSAGLAYVSHSTSQIMTGSAPGVFLSMSTVCRCPTAGATVFAYLGASGTFSPPETVTNYVRRMWAYWMGDL